MNERIVIDTNVLIGALMSPQGANREIIRRCLLGEYQPLMGNALFTEYEAVMARQEIIDKCPLGRDKSERLLDALMSVSEWVEIYYSWRPNLRDEGDNHIIELAVAGNAKIVVTNNIKDFARSELIFPHLAILTPVQLIN
jgi:putative PIN family toxin of toxin-antitoxin system